MEIALLISISIHIVSIILCVYKYGRMKISEKKNIDDIYKRHTNTLNNLKETNSKLNSTLSSQRTEIKNQHSELNALRKNLVEKNKKIHELKSHYSQIKFKYNELIKDTKYVKS